ncbi:MAG: permease-like cell division protein FtsX [Candidatus Eremiobacteraeota bacterium]|nr:permease-like cell division protein FtsX [Candidatus Eremiobacteraeota bacterium]
MQATAIGTVTVTIILLGVFLYVRAMLSHLGTEVFNQIEISSYLVQDITPARTEAIRTKLAQDPRILSVAFIPKKQGLRDLRVRMKGQIDTSILTENPLPDKMRIRVRAPEEVPAVARYVKSLPGIASVNYGQDIVTRLLALARVMRTAGIVVISLFILVAAIIISNTIRLTVFARRREISIMQLVGATNMYIRAPFICEGFLAGILGTLTAVVLLAIARAEIVPKVMAALPFVQLNAGAIDVSRLTLELFVVGGAVGVLASWISVGRYLRT